MAIEGSIPVSLNEGVNTVQMPQSGLTIVGITIYEFVLSIPIKNGFDALFLSGTGPLIQEVAFHVPTNNFTCTMLGGGAEVIFYYGTPKAKSPTLEDYAGVLLTGGTLSLELTGQPVAGTASVSFPGGGYVVKAFNMQPMNGSNGAVGVPVLSFHTETGKSLTLYGAIVSNVSQRYQYDNIIGLNQKMSDTLNYTYNVFLLANPTTAYSQGFPSTVLYYSMGGSR